MQEGSPTISRQTLPSLVMASGEHATAPLSGILRRHHPQPAHAPRLRPRRGGVPGLVRGARGCASIAAVQPLHVAAWIEVQTPIARRADREAAPGRDPPSVRLAGDRPGDADQSGRLGARPVACVKRGKTPVLAPEEARALLDSIDVTTHAGLRDRALIGLMVYSLRAHRRGARDEGRGRVHAEPPAVGAAAREGRQGARNALPPQPGGLSARLYRRRGLAGERQGAAVPHHRPRHRRSSRARPCPRPTPMP